MKIGSLFSGVGGLELGLEQAGLGEVIFQVERDPYCRSVLARHWPNARRFDDVRTVSAAVLPPIDLLCGGFPCTDVSSAGKRRGLGTAEAPTENSGLWYEFDRIIGELRPRWVIIENVASGASRWLPRVRRALGARGYDSVPVGISAAEVGARHQRERVFVVARLADAQSGGRHGALLGRLLGVDSNVARGPAADPLGIGGEPGAGQQGRQGEGASLQRDQLDGGEVPDDSRGAGASCGEGVSPGFGHSPEPALVRAIHGVPAWMDGAARAAGWATASRPAPEEGEEALMRWARQRDKQLGKLNQGWTPALVRTARIKALGNCVVPACAEKVGRLIVSLERGA